MKRPSAASKNARQRHEAMRCENCRYAATTGYELLRCVHRGAWRGRYHAAG